MKIIFFSNVINLLQYLSQWLVLLKDQERSWTMLPRGPFEEINCQNWNRSLSYLNFTVLFQIGIHSEGRITIALPICFLIILTYIYLFTKKLGETLRHIFQDVQKKANLRSTRNLTFNSGWLGICWTPCCSDTDTDSIAVHTNTEGGTQTRTKFLIHFYLILIFFFVLFTTLPTSLYWLKGNVKKLVLRNNAFWW